MTLQKCGKKCCGWFCSSRCRYYKGGANVYIKISIYKMFDSPFEIAVKSGIIWDEWAEK